MVHQKSIKGRWDFFMIFSTLWVPKRAAAAQTAHSSWGFSHNSWQFPTTPQTQTRPLRTSSGSRLDRASAEHICQAQHLRQRLHIFRFHCPCLAQQNHRDTWNILELHRPLGRMNESGLHLNFGVTLRHLVTRWDTLLL